MSTTIQYAKTFVLATGMCLGFACLYEGPPALPALPQVHYYTGSEPQGGCSYAGVQLWHQGWGDTGLALEASTCGLTLDW